MICAGRVCMACGYFHILKNIRLQVGIPCRVTDKEVPFHYKESYHTVLRISMIFFSGRSFQKYSMILTQRLNCKLTLDVTRHNWVQEGSRDRKPAGH